MNSLSLNFSPLLLSVCLSHILWSFAEPIIHHCLSVCHPPLANGDCGTGCVYTFKSWSHFRHFLTAGSHVNIFIINVSCFMLVYSSFLPYSTPSWINNCHVCTDVLPRNIVLFSFPYFSLPLQSLSLSPRSGFARGHVASFSQSTTNY